ncbi:hypothetical protein C7M84_009542 [Penaeus vannamei]|uniref:Uncharacterized protein n=1 Tax=Penaeus vannamei TaxID=6689 RepID=A0A423T6N6_PENVA|nr:hypothetical protein C7M84_009542 [Penaeus vannamei]
MLRYDGDLGGVLIPLSEQPQAVTTTVCDKQTLTVYSNHTGILQEVVTRFPMAFSDRGTITEIKARCNDSRGWPRVMLRTHRYSGDPTRSLLVNAPQTGNLASPDQQQYGQQSQADRAQRSLSHGHLTLGYVFGSLRPWTPCTYLPRGKALS